MKCGRHAEIQWTPKTNDVSNQLANLAKVLTADLRDLRRGQPEVMKAFSAIAHAALAPKALDIDELIALGISVALRCDDCIAFRAKAAADRGASRDEVLETLGMAISAPDQA